MVTPERGTIIEGIGDEIITYTLIIVMVVLPVAVWAYYWITRTLRLSAIDPASQATVNRVRAELHDQNRERSRRRGEGEITCPICLSNATYAVQTNCGHIFCGRCIGTYYRHGNWVSGLRCAVCRTQVTILLRYFSAQEQAEDTEERREVITEVNTYNRRHSGDPIYWQDYLRDLPTLLRHLVAELFSVGGMVFMFRLRVLVLFCATLLYFLSPLDIIPEAVFGIFGLLDDVFILILFAVYVSIIYRQFIVQRATNEGG